MPPFQSKVDRRLKNQQPDEFIGSQGFVAVIPEPLCATWGVISI